VDGTMNKVLDSRKREPRNWMRFEVTIETRFYVLKFAICICIQAWKETEEMRKQIDEEDNNMDEDLRLETLR
jgi:hypothetical protein